MQLNFKKTLALALSAAMVLTAAPLTSTTANAAAKVKLSATKGTIKVGKTKKVKIKNTKKSNIKKVTFKYSKKNIVKAKRSGLTIKFTGKKKGTSTVTVKVTLKKAVAGKKSYTLKYKATVEKAAATKVAVTGVTLSNSTPKVGDTITATVEPANASSVTYQWYTGDTSSLTTAISGATEASFAVTKDQLGKFVGVVVTDGTNGKTYTAVSTVAVQDAVTEDLAIVEAKQTGAKTAEISFNKEPAGATIVVSKDNKTVSQEVLATEGAKVTLQFGSNLVKGDYTIKVTDADKKTCEGKFTAEDAILTTVDFVNKNLMVTSNTTDGMKKAYAVLTSQDQWGNHMNLSGATFTVSKESSHSFNADSGVLTVNAPTASGTTTYANANYTIGETVVVTVQYNQGQTPKVITGVLTVTLADSVKTLTFGELTTDNKDYKGKDVTQEALKSGDYYFPVTEALSEAGIKLDTDMLNSMLQTSDNVGGTLFISPNSSTKASAYAYANGFVEKKVNGVATPCLSIKAGNNIDNLNIDLNYTITAVSQSGLSQTLTVPIKRNAVIKTLEVTNMPAFYAGKYVELPLKATDIYGNDFNLYDKITLNNATAAAGFGTSEKAGATIYVKIDDEKTNTDTNFAISSTGGVKAKVVVDTTKKTSTLMVCPQAKGNLTITGTTAGFGAINYANNTVNELRETTGIQKIQKISTSVLENTAAQAFTDDQVVFTGADSEAVSPSDENYPFWSEALLQTGTGLLATTGTGADQGKQIVYKANDVAPTANGGATNVTSFDQDGTTAWALPTTTTAPRFVWSASLLNVTCATVGGNDFVYTGNAVVLNKDTRTITAKAGATTGASDTLRIYLYKITANPTAGYDVAEVTKKDIEFTVVSEEDVTYKLEINKEGSPAKEPKLYSGKAGSDSIGVTLTTTTGAKVDQDKLADGSISFTIDGKNTDAFVYDDGQIWMTKALGADGKAKMSATFATEGTKTASAECEFEYTKETPYAVAGGLYNTTTWSVFDGSEVFANNQTWTTGSGLNYGLVDAVANNGNGYQVIVFDQYGNNIATDWADDAKTAPVSAKITSAGGSGLTGAEYTGLGLVLYAGTTVSGQQATVTIQSGSVARTFYVKVSTGSNGKTWEDSDGVAGTVYSGEDLVSVADLATADPSTVYEVALDDKTVLKSDLNIPSNMKVTIKEDAVLATGGHDIVNGGIIENDGTINVAAASAFTTVGTLNGDGTVVVNDDTDFEAVVKGTTTNTVKLASNAVLATATQTWTAPVVIAAQLTLDDSVTTTAAKPVNVTANGKIVIPDGGTLTVVNGCTLTNQGTIEVGEGTTGILTNNGIIADSNVIDIKNGGKINQNKTATFAGGTKTKGAVADTIIVSHGSSTTFTSAPDGTTVNSIVLTADDGFIAGNSITLKVGTNAAWSLGQGAGGQTATNFADMSDVNKLAADKDITISSTQITIEG